MKEGREVQRCEVVKTLKGERENLEVDEAFDGEPVVDRGDVLSGCLSGKPERNVLQ